MDDGGSLISIGFIVCCFIVLEAILFGFGAALQSIGDSTFVESESKGNKKIEKIRLWKNNPENLIYTIQIVSVLLYLLQGSFVIHTVFAQWQNHLHYFGIGGDIPLWALDFIVICFTHFICLLFLYPFGIHIPKLLGKRYARQWCLRLVNIVSGIVLIFKPITWLLVGFSNLILKIFGVKNEKFQEDVTEEEIISMVNEGHEQGMLEATEAEMINNIIEWGDKDAQDIMTHRKNIVAVDGNLQLSKVSDFILNASHSRFPVFEGNIDNIIGILHVKDAMKCLVNGSFHDWMIKDISELIRPAVFIPETRKINQLFQSMQYKKLQMVMVADEYGQTSGLVALEDLIEEIVGNIQDEYDVEVTMIERQGDGSYLINGMTPLDEVEEVLGTQLYVDADIGTLNGYLVSKLEKIPSEDELSIIEASGYQFKILSVAEKTIRKVKVSKIVLPANSITENSAEAK